MLVPPKSSKGRPLINGWTRGRVTILGIAHDWVETNIVERRGASLSTWNMSWLVEVDSRYLDILTRWVATNAMPQTAVWCEKKSLIPWNTGWDSMEFPWIPPFLDYSNPQCIKGSIVPQLIINDHGFWTLLKWVYWFIGYMMQSWFDQGQFWIQFW